MRYENFISEIKNYSYREFRELYQQVKYGLQVYGSVAEDSGDARSVKVYHDLIRMAYEFCKGYLNDIRQEDDEYGTLAYTGYCRSYRQAASRFLEAMERVMDCRIDFIIYDGEINSVSFHRFDADSYEIRFKDGQLPF
jgi:hypothetical protein